MAVLGGVLILLIAIGFLLLWTCGGRGSRIVMFLLLGPILAMIGSSLWTEHPGAGITVGLIVAWFVASIPAYAREPTSPPFPGAVWNGYAWVGPPRVKLPPINRRRLEPGDTDAWLGMDYLRNRHGRHLSE